MHKIKILKISFKNREYIQTREHEPYFNVSAHEAAY